MTALVLQRFGGANAPNGSRFHVQARSREFLRRGLVLSGAIHVALLLAFLNLHGSGDDVLLRSYGRTTDIFRQPPPVPIPTVPTEPGTASHRPLDTGSITPVKPEITPMKFDGKGVGPFDRTITGEPSGGMSHEGDPPGGLPPPPDPNRVFRVEEVDDPPVAIFAPKPVYPECYREAGITGTVQTEVQVNADGTVARVVIKSGLKLLADAAREGLVRWRFRPAMSHGRPVAVRVEIPVNFIL